MKKNVIVYLLLNAIFIVPSLSQNIETNAAPVIFNNDTIFSVSSKVGSFTPQDRAQAISKRMESLLKSWRADSDKVTTVDGEGSTDIVVNDIVIMTVTDGDAGARGKNRKEAALELTHIIEAKITQAREQGSLKTIIIAILLTLLSLFVLYYILRFISIAFARLYRAIEEWKGTRIRALKIQSVEIFSVDRLGSIVLTIARGFRIVITILLIYFFASIVFVFFPQTQKLSQTLLQYILTPVLVIWNGFLEFLPSFFSILIIAIVTRYVLKGIRFIFLEVEKGTISFPGFYKEWAMPTYKIIRLLILALSLVILYPYIPGSNSEAFKGVSVFLGLLFSLSSAGAVANIISGILLTYTRAFQLGDRVNIGETTGDVLERRLLVTKIRTTKNEDVTIPNSLVLGGHIINYSSSARENGLILHTKVTIGYDVPWRTIHGLLLNAAKRTQNILQDPPPFVLQTALDDFYVCYELNVYTREASLMPKTYAELHQNIQDQFNDAGIQIMSPHYENDPSEIKIPKEFRNKGKE